MTLRHRLHRVLYVPLDDRPYNLRAPRLLAQMVDYEMLIPPTETLGSFRSAGQAEEIAAWLRAHADPSIDCIILSADMLAYGGLWASRASGTRTQLAHQRLDVLGDLRQSCPEAPIYAYSSIMQLGSVTSADEAAQYVNMLVQYSVLAGSAAREGSTDAHDFAAMQRRIPSGVLGEYLAVRQRNHEINLRLARELAQEHLDLLVYGQDTAGPVGVHLREQAEIRRACEEMGVAERGLMVSGVDQLGICLLARFVHSHMEKSPAVRLVVADESALDQVPPGEDRPCRQSIEEHLALIGATEARSGGSRCDMVMAVNALPSSDRSELHSPQVARDHRKRARQLIGRAMEACRGRGLAVCDVAFPDGADDIFVQEVISATPSLPSLLSYAGWNSASNSIGSALAQGTLRLISLQDKGAFDLVRLVGDMPPMRYLSLLDSLISSEKAHIRLLLTRLTDDWLYQARVRPRLLDHITTCLRTGVLDLASGHQQAEALLRDELTQAVSDLWIDQFLGRQCVLVGSDIDEDDQTAVALAELEETRLYLPWRRLYEIELEVEFGVQLVAPGEVS